MNIKDKVESDLYKFIGQDKYKSKIESSKEIFYKQINKHNLNDNFIMNFSDWIIHNFTINNKNFIQEYMDNNQLTEEELKFLDSKQNSYLSIYEFIKEENSKKIFQDIFTREKYKLDIDEEFKAGDLAFTRLINYNGENILASDIIYIPKMFKISIEKNIKVQYEEYKRKKSYATMVKFLKENSMLLYKHISVVEDVLRKEVEKSEEYDVYQSVYLFKDRLKLIDKIDSSEFFIIDYIDEDETLYNFVEAGEILAKALMIDNRLEVECNSEVMRTEVKRIIEEKLGDLVHHYKDEIVKFEDLI